MATSIERSPKTTHVGDSCARSLPDASKFAEPKLLWIYSLVLLVLTAAVIALFDAARLLPSSLAPRWFSGMVAGSLAAAISGFYLLHRQTAAAKRAFEETLQRRRIEQSLIHESEHLARKEREEREVRGAQELLQATIDALAAQIAILDDQGIILAVNQAWRHFADENGFVGKNYGIETRYLDFGARSADHDSGVAARGIGDVLQGQTEGFRLLYPCTCVDGQRWFQLRVSRFTENGAKRLLVSHEDVTEVKMAQQAQREIDNRILQSRDEERRRIARELHDSTVQKIFAVNLNLMGLKPMLNSGEKKVQGLLAETISLGRECMQELRTISYLLRPPLPAGHDFLPALYSYIDGFCKRSGIRVNLVLPSHAGRMPAKVENALFRVVQETLSNIHRHSQSATATVALRKSGGNIILEVKDQGKGMPSNPGKGPYRTTGGGLTGIEERVHELGGKLEIQPANPGTIVTATIPLTELNLGVSA